MSDHNDIRLEAVATRESANVEVSDLSDRSVVSYKWRVRGFSVAPITTRRLVIPKLGTVYLVPFPCQSAVSASIGRGRTWRRRNLLEHRGELVGEGMRVAGPPCREVVAVPDHKRRAGIFQ